MSAYCSNGLFLFPFRANKTAQLAQYALARRILPAHTAFVGDTVFVMATGEIESDITLVEILTVEAMEKAIINAINSVKN
jgi:L-aminopeptidase/D-esterase-like protein